MSTFPGVTLTVLWLTHLEAGPASALRMTRSLPFGNLGMVGFLAAFRFACPRFGLVGGTVAGYLASLTILALVVLLDRREDQIPGSIRRGRSMRSAEVEGTRAGLAEVVPSVFAPAGALLLVIFKRPDRPLV